MQQTQAIEGDESQSDTIIEEEIQIDGIAKEEGTPILVTKKD